MIFSISTISGAFFAYNKAGTGSIALSDVQCNGWESKLVDCPSVVTNTVNCAHEYDIAVSCQSQCSTHGELRLAGTHPDEGRVQVCIAGIWGTVCANGWNAADAQVVCRQLGYHYYTGKYFRL